MSTVRIIARLDIKGPNLVKGVHLEGLRVLGKPWDFAYTYYEEGADELIYIDAVASLYGRNNLLEIVRRTAEHIFVPLTVGGGIRTVDDIRALLRVGADKVAINTAAVGNPALISQAAKEFGSQCIVGSIQAKAIGAQYFVYTDNGRESTDIDVFDWARRLQELGAGELLITSIDREGTALGFDTQLMKVVSESVSIPVIACGGCGRPEHLLEAITVGLADAVCISTMFHYYYLDRVRGDSEFSDGGNVEFLKRNRGELAFMKSRLQLAGIPDAREHLISHGISCRIADAGGHRVGC